jgi:hypothetical protein
MTSVWMPPDTSLVRVVIRWAGVAPSPAEIVALRRFAPDLATRGLAEVVEMIRGTDGYDLGTFPGVFARTDLDRRAQACGLTLELSES